MIPRSFVASCACWCALPAAALLIRPDRDDSEYLELASRYTSSVPLDAPAGEGVLVAPRWLLTAGSVAHALQQRKAARIRIGAREHHVQSFHLHPDWQKGGPSDIALVFLRESVQGIEPTPIHRDADEAGKAVVITGHGPTGKIGERAAPRRDGRRRAGINTVDRVSPMALGLAIKGAEEASDLQAAALPAEAGRPAYLETKDGLWVAGIGNAGEDTNRDGILGNAGDWELYARVSAFAAWIDETMFKVAQAEAAKRR